MAAGVEEWVFHYEHTGSVATRAEQRLAPGGVNVYSVGAATGETPLLQQPCSLTPNATLRLTPTALG